MQDVERSRGQEALTSAVRDYYDRKREDRNLLLAGDSGIVNHHFGIGDFDRRRSLEALTQREIAEILHRLEMTQIDELVRTMGQILPEHRVLDAGCGRGGTTISIVERFGARADGITISPYQWRFATGLAAKRGLARQACFHLMNYLELDFPDGSFDHVVTNESTQYVIDVGDLVEGFARVLKPRGRYTNVTWCINDELGPTNEQARQIDRHYGTNMNRRGEYLAALAAHGFSGVTIDDRTDQAIPYWELRRRWEHRSGIEEAFLEGHRSRRILYLFITASKE
ncbi:MAG: SAM-dependent methyltransferase [Myxococcota bacterium]